MLPPLSVIVPSYNQAQFIEETLLSILDQNYPGLELIVIDGGSTDGTVDILKKYDRQIAYWVSEPDDGQSHAINKGFAKATGEWIAWMNSDDCYLPGTLVPFFTRTNHARYDFLYGLITSGPTFAEREYRQIDRDFKTDAFRVLLFFMATEFIIPSQSVFVRRSLLQQVGYLREDLHYVMDMEWFARIYLATSAQKRLFYNYAIAFFRKQPASKTINEGMGKMHAEARRVAREMAPRLPQSQQQQLLKLVESDEAFRQEFAALQSLPGWFRLAVKYPLHLRYHRSLWARGKQLLRKSFGLEPEKDRSLKYEA